MRWAVFALGCGTSWLLYLHRYTFALIKPKLQSEWNLSKTELGALDATFSTFYSTFQFPAGVAADLLGAHLFLGGIILVWSVALGLHAFAPNAAVLTPVRALFGLGQAGAFAALNRVARNWFPISIRTTAQGWIGVFSGRIGAASANILFAAVLIGMLNLDWRWALYLLAAIGVAHGLAFLLVFRDSPERHPWVNPAEAELIGIAPRSIGKAGETSTAGGDTANASGKPARTSLRALWKRMSPRSVLNLGCISLTSTLSTIADNIYASWIPLFLHETHHLEFKEMGLYSALPLLGGACGGAFGGYLNDRLMARGKDRRWVRSGIGAIGKGTAGVLIVTALLTSYENPYRFCILLFFVKFFADISLATRWGAVSDVGGSATASVFGFNNAVASIGAILAPVLYGYVADHFNWLTVFVIGGVMYGLCAASWLLINCTIPLLRDEAEPPPRVG